MIQLNGKEIFPTVFPDGTSQVWKLGDPPFDSRIDWRYGGDHEIMQILQLVNLLDELGSKVTLNIHYLPYARQDKPISNDQTFGLHTFWRVLSSFNIDFIQIFDPHCDFDEVGLKYDPLRVRFVSPDIDRLAAIYDRVCFPDAGAAKRYRTTKPTIIGEKVRDQATGKIVSYALHGEFSENDKILVVDDICDGGATFLLLEQSLPVDEMNLWLALYVSHGIFSKGTKELYRSYEEIITTSSLDSQFHYGKHVHITASPLQ